MKKLSAFLLILLSFFTVFCQPKPVSKNTMQMSSEFNIGSMVQPVPLKNKFADENYNIWCGSVIKGRNDKYYMLYSRWPQADGHYAWVINSEVALAVSDFPDGPFKHVKTILPARGNQFWDGCATHNPQVMEYKGRYYVYYMGTTGTGNPDKPYTMKDDKWWEYRNNQRIGVAFAEDIEGEWKRFDKPVIDISPDDNAYDALMVSNPAATSNIKGDVLITYKQVAKMPGRLHGGKVRFGIAFANSPLGPFVKEPNPIFEINDGTDAWMVAEDPYIWFQDNKYHAIVRDVIGKFTGDSGAWALLSSDNGKEWYPGKYPKVIASRFLWEDGTKSIGQLERPCILIEDGIPKMLYGAYGLNKERNPTCNVAVPLKNSIK
jgi:uncharacterized protein (DUF2147 family)